MKKLIITVFVVSLALVSFGINYINPVGPTLIPIAELLSSDISNEVRSRNQFVEKRRRSDFNAGYREGTDKPSSRNRWS